MQTIRTRLEHFKEHKLNGILLKKLCVGLLKYYKKWSGRAVVGKSG
jgi:hypothetical protein